MRERVGEGGEEGHGEGGEGGEELPPAPPLLKGQPIGSGSTATVFLAVSLGTAHLVALKEIPIAHSTPSRVRAAAAEVALLRSLCHPNIVRYLGASITPHLVSLQLEYCGGGTLASLSLSLGPLPPTSPPLARYTRQTLAALSFLHSLAIVHCDLKPANILLTSEGVVKLSDFGSSIFGEDVSEKQRLLRTDRGQGATAFFASPEIVTGGVLGPPVDIWAFGCVFVQLLSGYPPYCSPVGDRSDRSRDDEHADGADVDLHRSYHAPDVQAVLYRIAANPTGPPLPPPPNYPPPDIVEILDKIFVADPAQRPTADQLAAHPWFHSAH